MTKISSIIERALMEVGDTTKHKYQRMLGWAFDGIGKFSTMGFNLKQVTLEVTHLNTVNVPTDFHAYRILAAINGDKLIALAENRRINIKLPISECGDEIKQNKCCHGDEYTFYSDHNFKGNHYNDYGKSGLVAAGRMRLDYERRQFILSGVTASHLLLEYYSILEEDCLDLNYEVDNRIAKAVRYYVIMKMHDPSVNKNANINAFRVAEMNFRDEARRAHANLYPLGIEEVHAAWLNAYKLTTTGVRGY